MTDIGTVLGGRYRLVELLGQGGMATIYRARDNQLERDVAVKVLRPEYGADPDFIDRFRHEAQSAASLNHPGIVAVHDEELIFQRELAELRAQGLARTEFDRIGAIVAYKAVLLEGTEVAFIVIAFGAAGPAALNSAIVGAILAGILVVALGAALRHPLTMVPENWMKFGVGALLSSFGVFWFAEGLKVEWPGDALSILPILGVFLIASWAAVRMLAMILPEGAHVEARNV